VAMISEAQARRLGITRPASRRSAQASEKHKRGRGRTRSERKAYDGDEIRIVIALPDDPRPKERPRTVPDMGLLKNAFVSSGGNLGVFLSLISKGFSRTYTPAATRNYENLIAFAVRQAIGPRPPFECPVETEISFVLKGDSGVWPTSQADGDADNLEKAVLDAMNGIVFKDDRLVVRSVREKVCGPEPQIRIIVRPALP